MVRDSWGHSRRVKVAGALVGLGGVVWLLVGLYYGLSMLFVPETRPVHGIIPAREYSIMFGLITTGVAMSGAIPVIVGIQTMRGRSCALEPSNGTLQGLILRGRLQIRSRIEPRSPYPT